MVQEVSVDGSGDSSGNGSPFDFAAEGDRPGESPGESADESAGRPSSKLSVGVLCIHGFTGTPFQMRYLGRSLAGRGMRAVGPLLPGHGTVPDDLAHTTWADWYGAVDAQLSALRAACARVAVVGLSLGGLLALRLAQKRGQDIAAVASLAAPLWLTPLPTALVNATRSERPAGRLLARMLRKVPKLQGADVRDRKMKRASPGYRIIPLAAVHQLVEFMAKVRADLQRVATPTLVIHARRDHTAPFACARELTARVPDSKLHVLSRSYHNITIDVERDEVAASVGNFFADHLRSTEPKSS